MNCAIFLDSGEIFLNDCTVSSKYFTLKKLYSEIKQIINSIDCGKWGFKN